MFSVTKYIHRQYIARPLAVFSACFLLGVLHGKFSQHLFLPINAAAAFVLIAWLVLKKPHWIVIPLLAAFLLGNARTLLQHKIDPPVPELFSVNYSGTVISDPYYNEVSDRLICVLHLDEVDSESVSSDVRLYLRSDVVELTGIEYGLRLEVFGHIWPQDSATNPYQYDAMNGLRADGLEGMAAARLEDVQIHPARFSLGRLRILIRNTISDQIDLLFPKNAALVRAFVLGDRSGLDVEMREAFNETGVTHLICISGLHISTLAMAVSKLLSLKFSRKAATLGTLAAVFLYGLLIGFPASLIRATVMFAVFSFAPIAGKPSDPITRLSAALLLMLLVNPFCIYDGGFVLSFSASAGILLLTEPLENLFGVARLKKLKPHPKRSMRIVQKAIQYFPSLLCTTLAAQLATLPAVIAYFGGQQLISIPVNLLTIPLAMTAYPLALIALMISAVIAPAGQLAALLPETMFSALTWLIEAFASLPVGSLRSPSYPGWLTALHCLLVLASSGLNRIPIRIRKFIPLASVLLIGVSILNAWIHTLGFSVIFLDAGQADAAVIKTEGHVYLFDVGDTYSPAADYVSGSCLGVDAVFLSHPHYDHAGGLQELLEELPPKVIYVPEGWYDVDITESVAVGMRTAREMGIPIIELSDGDQLQLSENVSVTAYESSDPQNSVNDLSVLLEVRYHDRSIFFTGDISDECEPEQLPDVDVLKVPHHGSPNATSERFLEQTTPEISVISVGENNYGHPSEKTIARLEAAGSEIYRTDERGAIEIRIDTSGEMKVSAYLSLEE